MLTIPIRREEGAEPLYEQIYAGIRREIEQGHLQSLEKLPSKRSLALHLQVSVSTIQAAYDQLTAEGYLLAKPRSGYYVAQDPERLLFPRRQSDSDPEILFHRTETPKLPEQIRLSTSGVPDLQEAIAEHLYAYRHMRVQPEQILIGAGSEYLLGIVVQLLGRQMRYAVEDPGYHKTREILTACGVSTLPVPVDGNGMQVDLLSRTGASVVHVTPSHHFPTGSILSVERRLELLQWVQRQPGRYILEEDYDSELLFTSAPVSALQRSEASDRILYLNTFAKTLAPSFRIGYLVLPGSLLQRYRETLSFYACTVSSLEQYTLVRFLREGYFERHLNRMKKIYRKRRDCLLAALQAHALSGFLRISGASAGPHFLLEVRTGQTEAQLISLARRAGVEVHGLSEFYWNPQRSAAGFPVLVIGYTCLEEPELCRAVDLLLNAWAADLEK